MNIARYSDVENKVKWTKATQGVFLGLITIAVYFAGGIHEAANMQDSQSEHCSSSSQLLVSPAFMAIILRPCMPITIQNVVNMANDASLKEHGHVSTLSTGAPHRDIQNRKCMAEVISGVPTSMPFAGTTPRFCASSIQRLKRSGASGGCVRNVVAPAATLASRRAAERSVTGLPAAHNSTVAGRSPRDWRLLAVLSKFSEFGSVLHRERHGRTADGAVYLERARAVQIFCCILMPFS
jgi:hypothetical protein